MWKFTIIVIMTVLITATAYASDLTGQDAPALNRREVISAGGALGAWINIDDFLGDVVFFRRAGSLAQSSGRYTPLSSRT